MIDYKPLKTKKIYKETKEWLSDSRSLMYERPIEIFDKFLNNEELPSGYGTLSGACSSLSAWYEELFIVSAFEEDLSSQNYLLSSLEYDSADLFIQDKIRWAYPERKFMNYSFRPHSLILAKSLALGNFQEAESIGKLILNNLKNDKYSGISTSTVAHFILKIFCGWKEIEFPHNEELAILPQFYESLSDNWQGNSTNNFDRAFWEACEYHIKESRYDTSKRYYDFNDHFYRLFPAELLSIIQLRKELNLKTSNFSHELLQLPTAAIPSSSFEGENEIIDKVKQKLTLELG